MIVRFDPHGEEFRGLCSGPVGPYVESFAILLSQQGYCRASGWQKVKLVADLSRWLHQRHIPLSQLDESQIAAFLKTRWKRLARQGGDRATMALLLQHLRQAHAISVSPPDILKDIDLIAQDYSVFLLQERALMPSSVKQYATVVQRFLSYRFQNRKVWLKKLCAKDVTDFVLHDTSNRGRRSAQLMVTVLRSFLSFLFQQGRIVMNLAAAVPTVAGWRLSELPRFLETEQIEKILRSCDRRRKVGKRDYAILLLLARLGLRGSEVVNLTLDDIDWRAGELLIRGKGARLDKMPLLQDVGQALTGYLQNGRPDCSSRRVFIQCKAPYVGFSNPPNAICGVVRRALARAKVHSRHQGAHVFRHSLATKMLGHGASLAQIGQVLRHEQVQTAEIYAKVDLTALRSLALPWPGGVQ